ncbi:sensor domain-containing protein [Kushneria phyllosphaerae]|uniref:Oxygen sensor protein DosP n=1 Tax=Kushneria phyllosphaerae TaxID=2100822 RepID=A0A2R8CML0_9GAMM|nr:EAL domain-containing protein [Kushneria phyllosphaerae]SPJ34140.1 Oxygen sensor protein DosP [Kushneria phyllosphaerae]
MSNPAFSRKPQDTPPPIPWMLVTLYRLLFALSLVTIWLLWWQGCIDDSTLALGLLLWLCCFLQAKGLLSKGYHRYRLKQDMCVDVEQTPDELQGVVYCYCHEQHQYCYLNHAAAPMPGPWEQSCQLPGGTFDAMVHPDDQASLKSARQLALRRGYFEHTYRLVHGASEQRVLDRGVILRRDGRVECHGLLVDISQLEEISAASQEEERGLPAGIVRSFSRNDDGAIALSTGEQAPSVAPAALRQAIMDGQLRLVYQPQVDGRDQHIVGFEVLLRWHDPDQGDIPPSTFIPMAESMGLMPVLGNWIIDRVCRQISGWRAQGYQVPVVAINVSVLQLDQALLTHVAQVLSTYQLEGACLEFEITESRMMLNFDECVHIISKLRQQGIGISLDDFGTGYSSLDKLAMLPLDRLKLDKSFVTALTDASHGYHMIEAIVRLAHLLRLTVVAEGVETRRQQHLLNELGCEILQGYLFGAGVEADKAIKYLKGRPD